ncbi:hypothetical protein BLNAU_17128 [Blattamonas nauphoetae]|uniref:Uncharacterized protein n=1 Tax=Blattamonas nauphoetae TaxID=2049346 RepID=A0ABQ9X7M3_9EUKA|nr:hypothetical protein BLNAU_17128 [Blattamonas nauphoetae]
MTEHDWAISTILDVEYIKPLEQYCKKTQPRHVSTALPRLLSLVGTTSESELDRLCASSIPSFLLDWVITNKNNNVRNEIGNCLILLTSTLQSSSTFLSRHKTKFRAFIDSARIQKSPRSHVPILARLCFSPHFTISNESLEVLNTQSRSDPTSRSILQTLQVPSGLTGHPSELVPFAGRLCSTLAGQVSQLQSLSTKASQSDATFTTLFATLPEESIILIGKAKLTILCRELTLLNVLIKKSSAAYHDILIDSNFVPLLKSTIVTCLDLSYSTLDDGLEPLFQIVESTFSDVPQLCSLVERTCCHASPTFTGHLSMIINVAVTLPHFLPLMLQDNLVERVLIASKAITVPTSFDDFHFSLVWTIFNLVGDPNDITTDKDERKRIQQLQFERVLKPAKRYLQFIVQREEFIPTPISSKTLLLERELFEDGEIVETGREEWEVGWLVEKTDEIVLTKRLMRIGEDDLKIEMNEMERWKKRVERQREAGHEDAIEGWLTRWDTGTFLEMYELLVLPDRVPTCPDL